MVTVVEKSNGKRLSPWEIANVSFHAEEEGRARYNELLHSAHVVPERERKKWHGKDLFEPGEIFYINSPTGEGSERMPHVYHEPIVDLGDHYAILDKKTNKLVRRVTHAIVVPKKQASTSIGQHAPT